jgi:hypothetical protein
MYGTRKVSRLVVTDETESVTVTLILSFLIAWMDCN